MANPVLSVYIGSRALPNYLGGRSRNLSPGSGLKNLKSVKSTIDTSWKTKSAPTSVSGSMSPGNSGCSGKAVSNSLKKKFHGASSPAKQTTTPRFPEVGPHFSRRAAKPFPQSTFANPAKNPLALGLQQPKTVSRAALPVPKQPVLKQKPTPKPVQQSVRKPMQGLEGAIRPLAGEWRSDVRRFHGSDLAEVPKHPEFSREFLDMVLDSLPEAMVDDLANGLYDFDEDGVADLAEFLEKGDGVPDAVDFLGLAGDANMIDFSQDALIDFSVPEISRDYTPDLIDFSEPDDRAFSLFSESAISDKEFEMDELMAEIDSDSDSRTEARAGAGSYLTFDESGEIACEELPSAIHGFTDSEMEAVAREALRVSHLIQDSWSDEMGLESEVLWEIPKGMLDEA